MRAFSGRVIARWNAPYCDSTRLIVGGADDVVLDLNRIALRRLACAKDLVIVAGATHLFEERRALEEVALFEKLVDGIVRAGIHVGEMAFCGRGEPLLHPEFTALMRHARAKLPKTFFSVVTSGNAPFHDGILLVDHLSVSIDGGFPDSCEVYRKGGPLRRVLRFVETVTSKRRPDYAPPRLDMPQLARQLRARGRPIVCWKYILFEHNDSGAEIVKAQELA